jgi:hypothetical protein
VRAGSARLVVQEAIIRRFSSGGKIIPDVIARSKATKQSSAREARKTRIR